MISAANDSGTGSSAVPYVLEEGEGEVIRWFGATLTVKASGPRFDVAVTTEARGSEPPLHVHASDDEALYVLDGRVTVFAGDEVFEAAAGAFVFLPRAVPHTFAVDSGSARLLVVIAPAGALAMYSDAEQRFGEGAMPARSTARDVDVVAATLAGYGVTILAANPGRRADAEADDGDDQSGQSGG
jgi:quercetin dioxygenase-like cupin family protein